jgi:elongation of very long chain fatty acids protein 6
MLENFTQRFRKNLGLPQLYHDTMTRSVLIGFELCGIHFGWMEAVAAQLFAFSDLFATDYERAFTHHFMHAWVRDNYLVFWGAVVIYLLFCLLGTQLMKSSERFDLRYPLAFWNALLSVFSFIGMLRTVPFLLGRLLTESFESSMCRDPILAYGDGTVGFWSLLFILSKIPELFDTVFIILRKRDLIVLHWYHHASVLLYCWHAYSTKAASGLYFIAMNYSVHSFMYGYFCAQALRCVPKNFPSYLITVAQISQMVVGTFVCGVGWYYLMIGRPCDNDLNNLRAGAVMYASYLLFFLEFAIKKFIFPPSKPTGDKKASKKKD